MAHEHFRTKRLLVLVLFLLAGCGGGPGAGSPGGSPDGAQIDASPDAAPVDTTADLDAPQEVTPDAAPDQVGTDGISPEDLPPLPDTTEIVDPVPVVTIDTPQPGFVRGTVEVTVTATGDPEVVKVRFLVDGGLLSEDDTVPYGVIWETIEFDDGDHEVAAVAFDAAGQTAEASVVVTVDNTPPDVSFLSPEPGVIQHDEVLLSVDATDNFQVDHVEFRVDSGGDAVEISEPPWELLYDGSALEAGLHTAFVSAVDAAGNETGMLMTFPVDRPPLVGFLVPAPGAVVTGPTAVQAEAWDDLGLGSVALFVDGEWEAALAPAGGDTYAADWIPTYEKGERLLSVIAVDSEGQETAAAVTVMVDHPVAVALQLCQGEVCSPLQAEAKLTGIVQLRATATDDGAEIASVDFLVDGVLAHQDLEAPYGFPWDTAGVADGARLLEALATNALDEIGAVQVQVQVNNCDLDDDDYAATGCGGPDCDDGDAGVNPSASDLVGNDADENCDGLDGVDADGDGHASEASGGDDCADDQPLAYPCGDDLPGDGADGNCDGADALSCDDCEPCTADALVGGLCIHGPYPDGAPCDDGDLCTAPGTCQDTTCLLGPPLDCDDGNPCTEDACQPESGCAYQALDQVPCPGGTCADGVCCVPACAGKECGPDGCGGSCGACGAEEECDAFGQCVTQCVVDPPAVPAMKITTLAVGSGGYPGIALDIDGDPETCAPQGNCSGGMHNQLGSLANQLSAFMDINQELQGAIDSGDTVLLADFEGFNLDGAPFVMRMFRGAPLESPAVCDWQAEVCPYLVSHEDFDPETCAPFAWFDNAVVVDGTLTAGGIGYSIHMPMVLPSIFADVSIEVPLWYHDARVEGEIVLEGGEPVGLADAVFGAAIPKQSLMDWADALPADALPVESQMVKNLIDMFVAPDIDVDGDGTKESASVAVLHDAIRATLVGMTEPPVCEAECLPWQVCAEPEGACTNPQDAAIIETPGDIIESAVEDCSFPCLMMPTDPDLAACMLPCVMEATGLSAACAACYSDQIACEIDCALECALGATPEECAACKQEAGCDVAFEVCVGFDPAAPGAGTCLALPSPGTCPAGGVALDLDCHGISAAGCCGGTELYYCAEGDQCPGGAAECLCRVACADNSQACGWDPGVGSFTCADGVPVPGDEGALFCSWFSCVPDCSGKECGPDGCGGNCGTCGEGLYCSDGACLTDVIHTFKHDQFSDSIGNAAQEMNGISLAMQPAFKKGEAFGQIFSPLEGMYPVKIVGVDLIVAEMPNDNENSATHASIDIYFFDGDGPDPGLSTPTFSLNTLDVLNPDTGEFGAPLVGNIATSFEFNWQVPEGHPPMLYGGKFLVAVRFLEDELDLNSEWGTFQCSQQPMLGLCGCQKVGALFDQASTPSSNVLYIAYPPLSCEGLANQWVWFEDVGVTGDVIIRARAEVAAVP